MTGQVVTVVYVVKVSVEDGAVDRGTLSVVVVVYKIDPVADTLFVQLKPDERLAADDSEYPLATNEDTEYPLGRVALVASGEDV